MAEDPKVFLRTQVKMAEKELERATQAEANLANKVRAALTAGDRALAEKMARELNMARDALTFARKRMTIAQELERKGRAELGVLDQELERARRLEGLNKAQAGLVASLEKVQARGADDMVQKLEEEAALKEARLELAMEERSGGVDPNVLAEFEKRKEDASAKDILRQLELDMGIEGRGGF